MITLKEAYEDLGNRIIKKIAEKHWEIARVKGIKEKTDEWELFTGSRDTKKTELLKRLRAELKEQQKNLIVLKQCLIKKSQ